MNFSYPDYFPLYFDADVIYYVNQAASVINNIGRKKANAVKQVSQSFQPLRTIIMAKKGTTSHGKARNADGQALYWVNVSLSDADILELEQCLLAPAELVGQLAILLGAGYNITLKHSSEHDVFTGFLFGPPSHAANANKALTARAAELSDCLNALLFKHYTVLGAVWPDKLQREKSRFG